MKVTLDNRASIKGNIEFLYSVSRKIPLSSDPAKKLSFPQILRAGRSPTWAQYPAPTSITLPSTALMESIVPQIVSVSS